MSLGKRKENSMKLILDKKINKPKELWKTLKSMGLSSKAVIASNICFIKNAADVLAQPIFELCNLSIKLNSLPRSWL